MTVSLVSRLKPFFLAGILSTFPLISKAELFPDGLLGVKLGQSRVAALTALVNEGLVPDLEKTQCSDKVPDKNKSAADRICKIALQPGSTYKGLPVTKVSFLFKEEAIVLMGLYVGESENTFEALRIVLTAGLGAPTTDGNSGIATWQEAQGVDALRKTKVGLWADAPNAFVIYSYADIR